MRRISNNPLVVTALIAALLIATPPYSWELYLVNGPGAQYKNQLRFGANTGGTGSQVCCGGVYKMAEATFDQKQYTEVKAVITADADIGKFVTIKRSTGLPITAKQAFAVDNEAAAGEQWLFESPFTSPSSSARAGDTTLHGPFFHDNWGSWGWMWTDNGGATDLRKGTFRCCRASVNTGWAWYGRVTETPSSSAATTTTATTSHTVSPTSSLSPASTQTDSPTAVPLAPGPSVSTSDSSDSVVATTTGAPPTSVTTPQPTSAPTTTPAPTAQPTTAPELVSSGTGFSRDSGSSGSTTSASPPTPAPMSSGSTSTTSASTSASTSPRGTLAPPTPTPTPAPPTPEPTTRNPSCTEQWTGTSCDVCPARYEQSNCNACVSNSFVDYPTCYATAHVVGNLTLDTCAGLLTDSSGIDEQQLKEHVGVDIRAHITTSSETAACLGDANLMDTTLDVHVEWVEEKGDPSKTIFYFDVTLKNATDANVMTSARCLSDAFNQHPDILGTVPKTRTWIRTLDLGTGFNDCYAGNGTLSTRSSDVSACVLRPSHCTSAAALNGAPKDDDFPWLVIWILLALLICCCLIIAAVCARKRLSNNKKREEMPTQREGPAGTNRRFDIAGDDELQTISNVRVEEQNQDLNMDLLAAPLNLQQTKPLNPIPRALETVSRGDFKRAENFDDSDSDDDLGLRNAKTRPIVGQSVFDDDDL